LGLCAAPTTAIPSSENDAGLPDITAISAPSGISGVSGIADEDILWRGNIRIQWDVNEVVIPSVAYNLHIPAFTPLLDATTWPTEIICDTSQLTEIHSFFAAMTEKKTQWLAKFVPLATNTINSTAMSHLSNTMAIKSFASFIPTTGGTIYLWSTRNLGLIAVYKPNPSSSSSSFSPFDMLISNNGSANGSGNTNTTNNNFSPFAPFNTRPANNGIWTGFLQVRLRERAENLYVSACQSNISRDFGVLDASNWPFNMWCAPSNMLISSPLLNQMHENTAQWIVRFIAATPSDNHTQNALRSLAVYMQARRLMFEISCGTLNGDELMLCLFGVVHSSYGNCIVGGFRVASGFDHAYNGNGNSSKDKKKFSSSKQEAKVSNDVFLPL